MMFRIFIGASEKGSVAESRRWKVSATVVVGGGEGGGGEG